MAKKLSNLRTFSPQMFASALYKEAQIEVTEIKKVTPVDTGALRATIHVEKPVIENARSYSVAIVAGGFTDDGTEVDYALIVHEDLEAYHKVGEAKYIERPLNESAPYLGARIAKRIGLSDRNLDRLSTDADVS